VNLLLAAALSALASGPARAENMDPGNTDEQYAWGENVGWINLEPSGDGGPGVQIDDFRVTGWMWGENVGWISLSCANRGTCGQVHYEVTHDGLGNLGGHAWGENVGWIRFSHSEGNVWIDPLDGVMHGYAWGENVGWIQMGSASGPSPYRVVAGWNCSPPPPLPSGGMWLGVDKIDGYATDLYWSPVTDATGYDVVYGWLHILRGPPGGDFTAAAQGCIGENVIDTQAVHLEPPPLDIGFWYLVRPVNCGGTGTYDSGGSGQVAPRDVGIEGSGINCMVP
jgi:hypothetical protein